MVHKPQLKQAVVIGAGSMGSGIAAHMANAGVPVLLLDIVPEGEGDRNRLAISGVERQLRAGGFMHPDCAKLVETGNVEDHFARLADADWIVEAVFENLAIKRDLYRRIDEVRREGSVVSSNTSTIPLAQLVEGQSDRFAGDFLITHFFNPPRHMQLVELVRGERTKSEIIERAWGIVEQILGKTVVLCRDTPGFIANRVGNFWMSVAVMEAKRQGLSVEEADAVMSAPFGIPRTGIFGLFDFVGINLVPLVWGSFMNTLAVDDAHRRYDITAEPLFRKMLAQGLTGRAGPGGFYRRKTPDGVKVDEALDLESVTYRPRQAANFGPLPKDLRALCDEAGPAGDYAWSVLSTLVSYAAEIADQIADSVGDIDVAMRLGYNWAKGPFELADQVGCDWIAARLEAEGRPVPARLRQAVQDGGFYAASRGSGAQQVRLGRPVLTVAALKSDKTPVISNAAASLWDMGDGVALLEIHTKMNACNADVVAIVEQTPAAVASGFSALVIGSDNARAFSAGADITVFLSHVYKQDWAALDGFVARGQAAWLGLKRAAFPVIAAARGLALGGGAELMMHADRIVAHAELTAGLPERLVGIIPGWGGTVQLLLRAAERGADPVAAAKAAFTTIANATPSASALMARDMLFLRPTDRIEMNRDHVLATAKEDAVALAGGYQPSAPPTIAVSGADGRCTLEAAIAEGRDAGLFTPTDVVILNSVASVLTGGGAPAGTLLREEDFLQLEREAMVELAKRPASLARLEAMRDTNRPLRN